MANYVLIDIGGTNVGLANTKALDPIAPLETKGFALSHDFKVDYGQLVSGINDLTGGEVTAIGFATAGQLDERKHGIVSARNLPEWVGFDTHSNLSQTFNCPVSIENDAVAAAWGEVFYGGGAEGDFMLVIWGTGVGGALVKTTGGTQVTEVDNEKYLAAIETSCGGRTLQARYGKEPAQLSDKEWDEVTKDFLSKIKQVAAGLGQNKIIFVGGVAIKQEQRILELAAEIGNSNEMSFSITKLGENFGVYGAAGVLRHSLNLA